MESRVGDDAQEIFAGVDTTLVGITAGLSAASASAARGHLDAYRRSVLAAVDEFGLDPMPIAPHLFEARTHLRMAQDAVGEAADVEFATAIAARLDVTNRAIFAKVSYLFRY